jgi:hypothetical protein
MNKETKEMIERSVEKSRLEKLGSLRTPDEEKLYERLKNDCLLICMDNMNNSFDDFVISLLNKGEHRK